MCYASCVVIYHHTLNIVDERSVHKSSDQLDPWTLLYFKGPDLKSRRPDLAVVRAVVFFSGTQPGQRAKFIAGRALADRHSRHSGLGRSAAPGALQGFGEKQAPPDLNSARPKLSPSLIRPSVLLFFPSFTFHRLYTLLTATATATCQSLLSLRAYYPQTNPRHLQDGWRQRTSCADRRPSPGLPGAILLLSYADRHEYREPRLRRSGSVTSRTPRGTPSPS